MKGTRALSFLLAFALLASLVIPGSFVLPAKADDTDSGMSISKKAEDNGNGTYTITLEAYATGEKVISTVDKDVPTDIILVLDQSGSMAEEDFPSVGTTTYTAYTGNQTRNSYLYSVRHNDNGNKGNLYYQLEDGSYVTVSVMMTQGESTYTYTPCPTDWQNDKTGSFSDWNPDDYWKYSNNLYVKNEAGEYKQVTVSRDGKWDGRNYVYVYTYIFPNGETVTSDGSNGQPGLTNFNGNGPVYYLSSTTAGEYTYTYTCTDAEGNSITIGTSTGANNNFTDKTLYYKTDTNGDDITRLQALKNAVTGFSNSVAQKAAGKDGILGTEDDIDHRIAVVGFAARENTNPGDYVNTEVFIGATQYTYGSAARGQYGNAFQDMKTPAGQSNVTASIGALDAYGGTHIDLGMEMAKGILDSSPVPSGEKHNRVVIVFTDGSPGSGDWSGNDMTYANNAISYANQLRASGVNVYTVGIFNGADATSRGNQNGNSTQKANWFMQNLSDNKGTPQTPSYYLSAANSSTLNNIFKQISNQIESGGSTTTLGSSSVVKDIIAPSFQLPAGATAKDITLATYSYTGEGQWTPNADAMGAEAAVNGDQVSVTGFNFSENWCGTVTENGNKTYRGSKLVISFDVVPKPGFLGGNDVPTNGTASGVYADASDDSLVKAFDVPTVNVPIATPEFTVNDKTIYEGKSTAVSGLYTLPDYTGDNAWKAAYVNVTTTGTTADETVSPTVCTDYTVTVTYAPKTNGLTSQDSGGGTANAMAGESASKTATVHVLHPVVTAEVHDVEKYYGESYTLGNDAGGSITLDWVDKDTSHTNNPAVEGTAPYTKDDLDLEYTTTQFAGQSGTVPKNNFDVTVTVKKGTDVVTGATITTTCNIGGSNCTTATDGVYTVHVKTCQLTINKTGGAAGEPYVFTVYKDNTKYSEVSIVGNSTATIVELPVGSYTIAEDAGWSWRYSGNNGSAAVLSADSPSGNITCTNSLYKEYWLNGFSTVVANIFGTPKN